MTALGFALFFLPGVLVVAAYLAYPVVLLGLSRRRSEEPPGPPEWPGITIAIPVYNEERAIAATIENILAADYPPNRRRIVIISDASTDGTDAIVSGYADRGVTLVRLERRSGKTAAENEAGRHLVGDVVVNLDATIRIPPHGLKALVGAFRDPSVGVASGRDVSVGDETREQNHHESTYVGYEMWVRELETRASGIVGASGCFYAIRRQLFDHIFPDALSRDFASPLIAREHGFRSVSVAAATCFVPRTRSLKTEYRRKVRTMTRGLETLWYKRRLLDPFRYGRFAWFLLAHKLLRWLVFLVIPLGLVGLGLLAWRMPWARAVALAAILIVVAGAAGYYWPEGRRPPRLLALAGFVVSAHVAGMMAWYRALSGELNPVWEPTRRPEAGVRTEESGPGEGRARR